MSNKRFISSVVEILLCIGLILAGELHVIDPFWSGMGTALLFVGGIFLIRGIRYKSDADYKEKYDTAVNDERNRFLAMKAWSWAGYLFVILSGVVTIVLQIIGLKEQMFVVSGCLCAILLLYWISYWILRKKY